MATELENIELEGILKKWSEITIERFQGALTRLKVGMSRDLFNSFTKQVIKQNGDVDAVMMKFIKYGRFVDMGVGGGISLNERYLNRRFDVYRNTEGRMVGRLKRRPKKWYSKILYKRIAELKYLLPPEMANQVGTMIREQLLNLNQ